MGKAFEGFTDDAKPCPVCLELAEDHVIQPRAVMPLPPFPARLRADNRQCCRDCQATETTMALKIGQHPRFGSARLTVANERIEGTLMPDGMMEHFGLCQMGYLLPSSVDDLDAHITWLERNDIPNTIGVLRKATTEPETE